jgi:glutathione S-transferase
MFDCLTCQERIVHWALRETQRPRDRNRTRWGRVCENSRRCSKASVCAADFGEAAMKLIGMLDSPYVRRVAISMKLLGFDFEHLNWSVGADFERIREYSPLGRVPALVLDDGDVLPDSAPILDYLDELAGPERALVPRAGRERREALRLISLAVGAAEKGRDQLYEVVFRPAEKRHEPWSARCRAQMHGALAELERATRAKSGTQWLVADRLSQADITVACMATLLIDGLPKEMESAPYPSLRVHVARCEALPEFVATRVKWSAPGA